MPLMWLPMATALIPSPSLPLTKPLVRMISPQSSFLQQAQELLPQTAVSGLDSMPLLNLASLGPIETGLADPVACAFWLVTFLPQNLWVLLVLLPNWSLTIRLMEPLAPIAIFSCIHLFIVGYSASQSQEQGTAPLDLFNVTGLALISSSESSGILQELHAPVQPPSLAEEWTHELIWDLFVGRYIWMDGRQRGIFTSHSVLLTNLIGPPGLLLHLLTVQVTKRLKSSDEIGETPSM